MTISVDDFMKSATDEQQELLFELADLAKEEEKAADAYNKKIKPYQEMARNANPMRDRQYTKIIQEDAGDFAAIAAHKEREKLNGITEKMGNLHIKAVEIGMGNLGIIQRTYEHYVGEPIPEQAS